MIIACVAAGGAVGAVLRYLCTTAINSQSTHWLPLGVLTVNVIGSLVIGLLVGLITKFDNTDSLWLFFCIGVLGSFTTFSTFSLETIVLMQQGELTKALANILLNVVLCLGATFIGLKLSQSL